MMKNIIIIVVLVIIILVLYGFNVEYGWIDFRWENIAIGAAGSAGPIQYFKNLSDEKKEDQELEERRYRYRVLEHKEYIEREKQRTGDTTYRGSDKKSKSSEDLFYNENALG